jgi:integrase
MNDPAEFWIELLPRSEDQSKPAGYRRKYCQEVLKLLAERHPDIYSGKANAVLTLEDANTLVDILKKTPIGHIYKHKVSYLVQGLEKGVQQLGWDAAIPHVPVIIPRDRPRLTYKDFQQLPTFYYIEKIFIANLSKDAPETPSARVGQLLLSSVLFGGLVQNRWLTPWIEALASPQYHQSTLWLDMVVTNKHLERERKKSRKKTTQTLKDTPSNKDWEIRRRWFADPLSQLLILRWYEKFRDDCDATHQPSPLLAIKHYLKRILPPTVNVSDSMVTDLLSSAAARLGLSVPPFLMAYAEGKIKSVSLPQRVWNRLLTGQRTVSNDAPIDEPFPIVACIPNLPTGHVVAPAIQEQLLRKIMSDILPRETQWALKATEVRSAMATFYEKNREDTNQTLACLIQWCIDMLTHYARNELIRGRVKVKLRPSSVRTYLDTIGKRLISVAGDLDILELESDELHDVYSNVVNLCRTKKSKHATGWRLVAFHQFLMVRCGAPPVDFSDISTTADPAETGVDANLLTPHEFDRVKKALAPNFGNSSRLRKIQFHSAILGFRCGLRRGEIRKLRLIDLQGRTEPVLLVRNNRYAYVKSEESIRRLPLATLLEPDELSILLTWHHDREIEDNGPIQNSLLFCQATEPTQRLKEYDVFPTIERAMREVTGDLSFRFHHLRHSFAAWLVLRLLKNFTAETLHRFQFLQHDIFKEEACNEVRIALLGNHRLGRQALFAVAQLCGHASPQVTLLHYMHLCDWLLAQELLLSENQPSFDAKIIAVMTGIKQDIIYYVIRQSENKKNNLSLFIDNFVIPEDLKAVVRNPEPFKVDKVIPDKDADCGAFETILLWKRVVSVLRERHLSKIPYSELARRNGVSEHEVRVWCENTAFLASMQTKRGKLRHVNRKTIKKKSDFSFPLPIHLKVDKEMAGNVLTAYDKFKGKKLQRLIRGVESFVLKFCVAGDGISFENRRDARDYIRFLNMLCIPLGQIRVKLTLVGNAKLDSPFKQKSLAKYFNLPEKGIDVRYVTKHGKSSAGGLTIQVMNLPTCHKGKVKASYGFRFAIYIIAIIHCVGNGAPIPSEIVQN